MRAAAYYRVSSAEQQERQTIETQRSIVEPFAALHGLAIAETYADDGVSGTIPLGDRPAGRRLIDGARAGLFQCVIVYRVDRFGRDTIDGLLAVRNLEALGVSVRSATEAIDTSSPTGRFMLTQLFSFASFERDTLIQRSVDGSNRLAREGAWLGGIVPFGYRVEGKGRAARIVPAEASIPECGLSEADVVRMMYRLSGDEGWSTLRIADHMNALGVPPAYVRDGREVLRGKRTATTQGIWRAGRIRNMLVSTTYKGIHEYGKRSAKRREVIERAVPALVSIELWDRARTSLTRNRIMSSPIAKHQYLLRGLIRCGCCGLTYCGATWNVGKGKQRRFYKCNGRSNSRGIYGAKGEFCPSKAITGDIEGVVWQDIEGFLRNPGPVIETLQARMSDRSDAVSRLRREAGTLDSAVARKQAERDAVVSLYRRNRIDADALDRQLDDIDREDAVLREDALRLQSAIDAAAIADDTLRSAEHLLRRLNDTLDGPLTWETKRRIVETLVEGITVETVEIAGSQREARARVRYQFTPHTSVTDRTDTGSWRQSTRSSRGR